MRRVVAPGARPERISSAANQRKSLNLNKGDAVKKLFIVAMIAVLSVARVLPSATVLSARAARMRRNRLGRARRSTRERPLRCKFAGLQRRYAFVTAAWEMEGIAKVVRILVRMQEATEKVLPGRDEQLWRVVEASFLAVIWLCWHASSPVCH
jgi:hypothetical protein